MIRSGLVYVDFSTLKYCLLIRDSDVLLAALATSLITISSLLASTFCRHVAAQEPCGTALASPAEHCVLLSCFTAELYFLAAFHNNIDTV